MRANRWFGFTAWKQVLLRLPVLYLLIAASVCLSGWFLRLGSPSLPRLLRHLRGSLSVDRATSAQSTRRYMPAAALMLTHLEGARIHLTEYEKLAF